PAAASPVCRAAMPPAKSCATCGASRDRTEILAFRRHGRIAQATAAHGSSTRCARVNVTSRAVRGGGATAALVNPPVLFCGAACKRTNESFTMAPHPTWGREQSPLAGNCQRAFYWLFFSHPREPGCVRPAQSPHG